MDHTEFSDPRLVALYDTLNPLSADTTFYLEAAARLRASTIVDVGCGTGLLTCDLAKRGYTMIGVEPERAMLAVARLRPGARVCRARRGLLRLLRSRGVEGGPADACR